MGWCTCIQDSKCVLHDVSWNTCPGLISSLVIALVGVALKEVVSCTVFPVVSLAMVWKEVVGCASVPVVLCELV